jgi:hypothetical protein
MDAAGATGWLSFDKRRCQSWWRALTCVRACEAVAIILVGAESKQGGGGIDCDSTRDPACSHGRAAAIHGESRAVHTYTHAYTHTYRQTECSHDASRRGQALDKARAKGRNLRRRRGLPDAAANSQLCRQGSGQTAALHRFTQCFLRLAGSLGQIPTVIMSGPPFLPITAASTSRPPSITTPPPIHRDFCPDLPSATTSTP